MGERRDPRRARVPRRGGSRPREGGGSESVRRAHRARRCVGHAGPRSAAVRGARRCRAARAPAGRWFGGPAHRATAWIFPTRWCRAVSNHRRCCASSSRDCCVHRRLGDSGEVGAICRGWRQRRATCRAGRRWLFAGATRSPDLQCSRGRNDAHNSRPPGAAASPRRSDRAARRSTDTRRPSRRARADAIEGDEAADPGRARARNQRVGALQE